jgi:hypothetical protein
MSQNHRRLSRQAKVNAMDKTTIIEKLVDNAPLLVLVLGVASFVPGATGGIYTSLLQLPVTDPIGRTALMVMGVVLVAAGATLLWNERRQKSAAVDVLQNTFNLRITHPQNHARVRLELQVRGTFDVEPPDGMARVIELVPNTNMYHAKSRITIDKASKTWLADIKFGGKSGDRRVFILVLTGKSADLLFEYYRMVGRETTRWIGIPGLPPDVIKCSQIEVEIE